jgi:hypothetical protein
MIIVFLCTLLISFIYFYIDARYNSFNSVKTIEELPKQIANNINFSELGEPTVGLLGAAKQFLIFPKIVIDNKKYLYFYNTSKCIYYYPTVENDSYIVLISFSNSVARNKIVGNKDLYDKLVFLTKDMKNKYIEGTITTLYLQCLGLYNQNPLKPETMYGYVEVNLNEK